MSGVNRRKRQRLPEETRGPAGSNTKENSGWAEKIRLRMKSYHSDKEELISLLRRHQAKTSEQYDAQRAAAQYLQQVVQLELSVADTQKALHEERLRTLNLQADIDQLHIQEQKDRQTIQLLVDRNKQLEARRQEPRGHQPHRLRPRDASTGGVSGLNRCPDEWQGRIENLKLGLRTTKRQLSEEKEVSSHRIAELERKYELEKHNNKHRTKELMEQTKTTSEDLKRTRAELTSAIKEILEIQGNAITDHVTFKEKNAELVATVRAMEKEVKQAEAAAARSAESAHRRQSPDVERSVERLTRHFRAQLIEKDKEIAKHRSDHLALERLSALTQGALEQQIVTIKQQLATEERTTRRRDNTLTTDLRNIKHQINAIQTLLTSLTRSLAGGSADMDLHALRAVHSAFQEASKAASDIQALKEEVARLLGD